MEKLSAESVRGTKANKQDRPQERANVLHCTQSVGLTRFICGIIGRIALHATFPRYGMVLCPAMAWQSTAMSGISSCSSRLLQFVVCCVALLCIAGSAGVSSYRLTTDMSTVVITVITVYGAALSVYCVPLWCFMVDCARLCCLTTLSLQFTKNHSPSFSCLTPRPLLLLVVTISYLFWPRRCHSPVQTCKPSLRQGNDGN